MNECVNEFITLERVLERHLGRVVYDVVWVHRKTKGRYLITDSGAKLKFGGAWYHAVQYRTIGGEHYSHSVSHTGQGYSRTHEDFFAEFYPVERLQ